MKTFKEYRLENDMIYEFANLGDKRTGLTNIYIHCYSQGNTKIQHGPRIKVSNVYGKFSKNDNFVLSVPKGELEEGTCKLSNQELQRIRLWIALNKKALLIYWNSEGEMDTDKFLDLIKKVK